MDIRFHKKLYKHKISARELASIKRKMRKGSLRLNLFLVTLPIGSQGILEVYWYPELLQTFYQQMKRELIVVGIAKSREEAFQLVEQIITDAGFQEENIRIDAFFKENT